MSSEKLNVKITYIDGFPFPGQHPFAKENIEASINYRPRDGDILICSYPKTGTTWMSYIIWQIIHKGESYPDFREATFQLIPFMELTGTDAVDALSSPRFYKHHLPCQYAKINEKAKYVYTYRNPEDTLTSFYYFIQEMNSELDFNDFFEEFLNGNVPYGNYFDHVLSFHAHKKEGYLLMISYEDLKRNPEHEILRIAKFLGEGYYQAIAIDESLLKKIVEVTSFSYMKKHLDLTFPGDKGEKKVNFFRKGIVGDGKNHLNEEQLKRLREMMLEKMKGTEYIDMWST